MQCHYVCCCCPRAVRLLLWRNSVQRKRAKCATFCEVISPVFITILFALLYRAFSTDDKPTSQYLDNRTDVPALAGLAYRLQVADAVIALGACRFFCCLVIVLQGGHTTQPPPRRVATLPAVSPPLHLRLNAPHCVPIVVLWSRAAGTSRPRCLLVLSVITAGHAHVTSSLGNV